MAAPAALLLLLLPLLGRPGHLRANGTPGLGRRFSEYKLCADEECSMLMYRGEALEDFTGPDCRFVNFKKGDPVYVYHKLAGSSPEVWAGSVGRSFGYFPRNLIQVASHYTMKELQVKTDETDFVCFDGGRDDFDSFNVEELLGYLNFAVGETKKAIRKAQSLEEAEPSEESDPETEPLDSADSGESVFSEDPEEFKDRQEAQRNHPLENISADPVRGEHPPLESFEDVLQEKLKSPESENKTSNGSQTSQEPEKMDAYTRLKKEMTVDLKTKFGSTADALVSDDETTRLVTSLEDDFDEELEAEYYAIMKEEEDDGENFEELPLLTFTDGEDVKGSLESGVEKSPVEKEQDLKETLLIKVASPPGVQSDDDDRLIPWKDSFPSFDSDDEDQSGMNLESSDSEEEEAAGEALVPDSRQTKPLSAPDDTDPEKAKAAPEGTQVPKRHGDRDSRVTTHSHLREGMAAEPKQELAQEGEEFEEMKQESVPAPSSSPSRNLSSLPSVREDEKASPSASGSTEGEPDGAVVRVSKETLPKEKPGMQTPEGDKETGPAGKASGSPTKEGKAVQASPDLTNHQHNTSRDIMEGRKAVESAAEPHGSSQGHPSEGFGESRLHQGQDQPHFSPPDGPGGPREQEEEVPGVGRNLTHQQEREEVTGVNQQVGEEEEVEEEGEEEEDIGVPGEEDSSEEALGSGSPISDTQEAGTTDQVDSMEEVEEEDDVPEELLEDENAVSAQQAKVSSPKVQSKLLGSILQTPERVTPGAIHPASGAEGNTYKASVPLDTEKPGEKGHKELDPPGWKVGQGVLAEDSPLIEKETQGPLEISSSADKKNSQLAEEGEAFLSKDQEPLQGHSTQDQLKSEELSQKSGLSELLKESQKAIEKKLTDTESQGTGASGEQEDELPHWIPPATSRKDLPIISSFFKSLQSWQRFHKYFDVPTLEALLQEMSSKLQAAQRESLPYNLDKALDRVFRASESHILMEAEKMLDARVTQKRELGTKDSNIFEEAAVLEDIQDLIYFVRYQHSVAEGSAGDPAVVQLPEEGWDQAMEETSPPLEDNLPQVHIEAAAMQTPQAEFSNPDQPVTGDTGLFEVPPQPSADPGLIITEGLPVNAVDGQQQIEIQTEELSTPLESTVVSEYSFLSYIRSYSTLITTLSDNDQLEPDIYGLPWKPVFITAFLGIASFAIFFWKTVLAVKSKIYQVTEQQISEKVKNIMKENAELQKKLLNYEQKMKESKKHIQEAKKQNMILSDDAVHSKDKIKKLEESNEALGGTAKKLRDMLASEREQNAKNQELILENKKSIEKLKDVISMNASELSEVQIALNEAKLSEEKVKSECHRVQEENTRLKKKEEQLQREIKDWSKSHSELSEQIKSFEKSQKDLEVALTYKDDNIDALTNCITQLNRLECESESESQNNGGTESDELANGEVGGNQSEKMKNKIKQMMDISRTQTAMAVVEEDLKLLQGKLRATMSTKCNLEDQIKKLEDDRNSLQSAKAGLEDECNTLRQKVEILNELYQQKEMVLQKKLSQEEYERQEREQRLTAADEKAVLAAEEVKTYKRRIEEMEEELLKTERSFKSQIATHEKKAHENWLKARAAERAMAEEKREAANLRHKLLELTQKMAMLQEEPVIVKPLPGRPSSQNLPRRGPLSQNGSFGPSPVSGGECSPPLNAELPARPRSATLNRREMPRSEFDPGSGATPMMNSSSGSASPSKGLEEGKQTVSQESEGPSVPSVPALAEPPAAVPLAVKGPPPFPGGPLMSTPMGGPLPPPIRYGPPPQLCRPFGPPIPPPIPPPFGPAMRPPLGIREYAPGIPPGKPIDPREFIPGHVPFRPLGPLGPREYYFPGTRLPPPPHGPQDYLPPPHGPQDHPPLPAARDLAAPVPRPEPPATAQSNNPDSPPAFKQSP